VISLLSPIQSIDESRRLFIDVGSGEGQILQYFAQNLRCKCLGIESDSRCHQQASQRVHENKELEKFVMLFEGDAEQFDYRDYCRRRYDDVIVYMFLSSFGYSVMGRILLAQLPIGSRVVTAVNPIGEYWKPLCVWIGDDHDLTLYLYVVTEQAQQSALSSQPSIQETRWRHPPPGSYSPRPIPEDVRIIHHDTSPAEVIELCKEYLRTDCQTRSSPSEGQNTSQIDAPAILTPSASANRIPSRPPPPPPPLPPTLPNFFRSK
jgi:SAM-dependent methyltransferase